MVYAALPSFEGLWEVKKQCLGNELLQNIPREPKISTMRTPYPKSIQLNIL